MKNAMKNALGKFVAASALLLVGAGCATVGSAPTGDVTYVNMTDLAYYTDAASMAAASDVVVVGEVLRIDEGDVLGPPSGSPEPQGGGALQLGLIRVRVDRTIKGSVDVDSVITFEREVWLSEGGKPVGPIALDGALPPSPGETHMLFLYEDRPEKDGTVYRLVSLDGDLLVDGDGVIRATVASDSRMSRGLLDGTPVGRLIDELSG